MVTNQSTLLLLADLILLTHALFVALVLIGLVAIFAGKWLQWHWVRIRSLRLLHLLAVGFVMVEAWLGMVCPLTEWENRLRIAAGDEAYTDSFIAHWLHELLFYDFAPWVFTLAYTLFCLLVCIAWRVVPPVPRKKG